LAPGQYELNASVRFSNGETQTDSFVVQVLPRPRAPQMSGRSRSSIPKAKRATVEEDGVRFQPSMRRRSSAFDTLIVGKAALTTNGAAPDITRVRDGLKVLIFEQTADVLEKRFGFRVAEYGLRQVFPRVPIIRARGIAADIGATGEAKPRFFRRVSIYTCVPLRTDGQLVRHSRPALWRCGNRGNVASFSIEKPARGDFLPIIDGGYSLQYSPLMDSRKVRDDFVLSDGCDRRTEIDPVAETLTRNIFPIRVGWKPAAEPNRRLRRRPGSKSHL
jgi:hypothetical protein